MTKPSNLPDSSPSLNRVPGVNFHSKKAQMLVAPCIKVYTIKKPNAMVLEKYISMELSAIMPGPHMTCTPLKTRTAIGAGNPLQDFLSSTPTRGQIPSSVQRPHWGLRA